MSTRTASSVNWGFLIFIMFALGILGFLLLTEHTAHLYGILPFLFLLACPILHMIGHRHSRDEHRDDNSKSDTMELNRSQDQHHH